MKRKEWERIGAFVITTNENIDEDKVRCSFCNKELAKVEEDGLIPTADELFKSGNVPVPNFGWFCSQHCGNQYSEKFQVSFQRDEENNINYYEDS